MFFTSQPQFGLMQVGVPRVPNCPLLLQLAQFETNESCLLTLLNMFHLVFLMSEVCIRCCQVNILLKDWTNVIGLLQGTCYYRPLSKHITIFCSSQTHYFSMMHYTINVTRCHQQEHILPNQFVSHEIFLWMNQKLLLNLHGNFQW